MRFHLLGLANVPVSLKVSCCPFTGLVANMAIMLHRAGHHVTLYGAPGHDVPCDDFVQTVPNDELAKVFDPATPHLAKWHNTTDEPTWQHFRETGRRELARRYRRGDVALISFGNYQTFAAEVAHIHTEFCCGYSGVFSGFRVFPSSAWYHYIAGYMDGQAKKGCGGVWRDWNDAIIPHYLNPDDFPLGSGGDNLVFIGRLHADKGVDIACDIARETGRKLVVAGVDESGNPCPDWLRRHRAIAEFRGALDREARLALLQGAYAAVLPHRWVEAFGMTQIEAMMCGTPIITSDWGSSPEINVQGLTGFRCRDFNGFCEGVLNAGHLSRESVRESARSRFSLDAVWPQYEEYFYRLQRIRLNSKGWYARGLPRVSRRDTDAMLRAMDEAAASPELPIGTGNGIVICAGGAYLPGAYVAIRLLRDLGCQVPVQVWSMGAEAQDGSPWWARLSRLPGVSLVSAPKEVDHGFYLKAYALAHTDFDRTLLLDADCVPCFDPTPLFHSPELDEAGCVFWPDRTAEYLHAGFWHDLGLAEPDEPAAESGQLLIDRTRHLPGLAAACAMNRHWRCSYYSMHGDKDSYRLAMRRYGERYTFAPPVDPTDGHIFYHQWTDGRRVFQHRMSPKWSATDRTRVPDFMHEDRCFGYLDDPTTPSLARRIPFAEAWDRTVKMIGEPFQHKAEAAWVYDRVQRLGAHRYVEIGSARGAMLLLMSHACAPGAEIVSIDLPGGPGSNPGDVALLHKAAKTMTSDGFGVKLFLCSSTEPEPGRWLQGKSVDVLYIDGDHRYDRVRRDVEMYGPFVRSGVVILHDIAACGQIYDGMPVEVNRLWAELSPVRKSESFIAQPGQWGTGILYY